MNRENDRSERGFGSMDDEQEVASKGGKAAHEKGTTESTSDDTPEAGKSGGQSRSGMEDE